MDQDRAKVFIHLKKNRSGSIERTIYTSAKIKTVSLQKNLQDKPVFEANLQSIDYYADYDRNNRLYSTANILSTDLSKIQGKKECIINSSGAATDPKEFLKEAERRKLNRTYIFFHAGWMPNSVLNVLQHPDMETFLQEDFAAVVDYLNEGSQITDFNGQTNSTHDFVLSIGINGLPGHAYFYLMGSIKDKKVGAL